MTKSDIIKNIAGQTGVDKDTISIVLEGFMATIKDSLVEKENVYLRGFGTFTAKRRAPKTARNIAKNTTVNIPERYVPFFKPSDAFLEEMNPE